MDVDVFMDGAKVDTITVTGDSIGADIATINKHYRDVSGGELKLVIDGEAYSRNIISVDMLIDEVTPNIFIRDAGTLTPVNEYSGFDVQ